MSDEGGFADYSPRLFRRRSGRSGRGVLDALNVGILLLNVGILLLNVDISLLNVGILLLNVGNLLLSVGICYDASTLETK